MFFTQNYWLLQMGCIHGLENWQIWKQQSQSWNAVGVRQHFNVEPSSAFVEIHWGSGLEAYVTPVSETSINVSLLGGGKALQTLAWRQKVVLLNAKWISGTAGSLKKLRCSGWVGGKGPLYQKTLGVANGKILLIGDAAGFFDPITDEGIGIAARQAL